MKYEAQKITEEELEMVTGGSKPGYQTTNSSTYSSGDMPKYKSAIKYWSDTFLSILQTGKYGSPSTSRE